MPKSERAKKFRSMCFTSSGKKKELTACTVQNLNKDKINWSRLEIMMIILLFVVLWHCHHNHGLEIEASSMLLI